MNKINGSHLYTHIHIHTRARQSLTPRLDAQCVYGRARRRLRICMCMRFCQATHRCTLSLLHTCGGFAFMHRRLCLSRSLFHFNVESFVYLLLSFFFFFFVRWCCVVWMWSSAACQLAIFLICRGEFIAFSK